MAQIALAWLRAQPAITAPIIAASNMKQLEENLEVTKINLKKEDLEKIRKNVLEEKSSKVLSESNSHCNIWRRSRLQQDGIDHTQNLRLHEGTFRSRRVQGNETRRL
jgi:predicted aldo/keto reductase-like oxidoreductase